MQSHLPDADMQAAPRALLRAAQRAREVARRTNTALVVIRDGVLVEERVSDAEDDLLSFASKNLPELDAFRST
jgi:hypothetical protein